jgi:DNA ligase-1
MEFSALAARLEAIERADSDTETTALVADLLREAEADLPAVVRVLLGRVAPAHESTTLDIGPQLCYEALARAAGQNVTAEDVEKRLADRGEIGAVAASYDLGGQRGLDAFGGGNEDDSLSVAGLVDELHSIAAASGSGSQDTKVDTLFGLFSRVGEREARYLARLVLSEMRLGVGEGTLRDAIAEAFGVPVETVERALQVSNDYGLVAETARDGGAEGLAAIRLEVGRPVKPMLAQAGTVSDAVEWGEVAVEWKYDGARVQVHYDGTDVRLYSRNTEDVTDPLPDIVATVREQLDVPAILDCEVVAVDDEGNPRPFQAVLRRFRRKHDIEQAREDVKLRLYAFDCLHADGEDLLDEALVKRHARLDSLLDAVSPLVVTDDPDEIERQEQAALAAGHEGIMLKNPDSAYTPGRRGQNWLKRKPDVETLDCVVTGAEWGEGRRATLLGTFELGVQDGEGYATVGKVATGITDEQLEALTERLEPHVRAEDGTAVEIAPAVVFEVGYEEIQTSPTYSAGYALRFPRFLGVREDKSPEDADTLARVERLAEG